MAFGIALMLVRMGAEDPDRAYRLLVLSQEELLGDTAIRGQLEIRLTELRNFAHKNRVIFFIDETQWVKHVGGTVADVMTALKPYMTGSGPNVQILGALTEEEYQRAICSDASLDRRFHRELIRDLPLEDTCEILRDVFVEAEIQVGDEHLRNIARESNRISPHIGLPSRAIRLAEDVVQYLLDQGAQAVDGRLLQDTLAQMSIPTPVEKASCLRSAEDALIAQAKKLARAGKISDWDTAKDMVERYLSIRARLKRYKDFHSRFRAVAWVFVKAFREAHRTPGNLDDRTRAFLRKLEEEMGVRRGEPVPAGPPRRDKRAAVGVAGGILGVLLIALVSLFVSGALMADRPDCRLTNLSDGEEVEWRTVVEATCPDASTPWILVAPLHLRETYHPQMDSDFSLHRVGEGQYSTIAHIGEAPQKDVGRDYAVILVSADEKADLFFRAYADEAFRKKEYPGLRFPLPPGAVERHRIVVRRVAGPGVGG
jgi:hypothetical protein